MNCLLYLWHSGGASWRTEVQSAEQLTFEFATLWCTAKLWENGIVEIYFSEDSVARFVHRKKEVLVAPFVLRMGGSQQLFHIGHFLGKAASEVLGRESLSPPHPTVSKEHVKLDYFTTGGQDFTLLEDLSLNGTWIYQEPGHGFFLQANTGYRFFLKDGTKINVFIEQMSA